MNKLNYLENKKAVANQSGAMEADTISKNGRKSKSQTSRRNIIKKISLLLVIFCISITSMFGQDIISMKNGDNIDAIVQEIGTDEVKYKRFDNPNGPTYTLKKSGIVMIKYSNGSSDVFTDNTARAVIEYESIPFITDDVYRMTMPTEKKKLELLRDFEIRMDSLGFRRRIVAYDFLSEGLKKAHKQNGVSVNYSVGIWLNYQKQLVAIRLERDDWNEIVIPFDKIIKAEIIEDGFTKTKGTAVGIGHFAVGNTKTNEKSRGLEIRIVTGDNRSGTKAYNVKLLDMAWGSMFKSNDSYKAMQSCALSISDEIDNIISYEW